MTTLVITLCLWLRFVEPVHSLTGAASVLTRQIAGVPISLTLSTAPHAEVVVVDSAGTVIAAGLDQGLGIIRINFTYPSQNIQNLSVFAIDQAGTTSEIRIVGQSLTTVLPPTLVVDPRFINNSAEVLVGGYAHPSATVLLQLTGPNSASIAITPGLDGAYEYRFRNLAPGTYRLIAVAEVGTQASIESRALVLEVTPDTVVNQTVTNVGKSVATAVEVVTRVLLPPVAQEALRSVAPQAQVITSSLTPVASVGLLTQLAFVAKDFFYLVTQGVISGLQYFGFWRKRQAWGLVYDAVTKHPIMLATIRLYDAAGTGQLVESDVSSKEGVFSFLPAAGAYVIKAAKAGYSYPSKLVTGVVDGQYGHVYHGESISVRESGSPVEVSIPLDPVSAEADFKTALLNALRTRIHTVTLILLMIGFVMALLALAGGGGALHGLLLLFYGSVLVSHAYLHRRSVKRWGLVRTLDGQPVGGVEVDLVDPRFEKLVQRRITDSKGRFQFVVPKGVYQFRLGSSEYSLVFSGKKGYGGETITIDSEKPKLLAPRLWIEKIRKD